MGVLSVAKDFQNLVKNISSFSDGQASVCYYTDDMSLIKVLIGPTGGLYKDGEFIFSVSYSHFYKLQFMLIAIVLLQIDWQQVHNNAYI